MIGREAGDDRVVPERPCQACEVEPALEGKPYCEECTNMLNAQLAEPEEE